MRIVYILCVLPLIAVNVWHLTLLILFRGNNRPDSISEHALQKPSLLKMHRLMHIIVSVLLISFSIFYLLRSGYVLAGILLIIGAIADIAEVVTLREDIPFGPTSRAAHQIFAWVMALSYLMYGIVVSRLAGLNPMLVNAIWFAFVVVLLTSRHYEYKKFWIPQKIYFLLLAVVIGFAHVKLF